MEDRLKKFSLSKDAIQQKNIEANINPQNNYLELRVNSYADFDYIISIINQNKWTSAPIYYRGVSNRDYDLKCSLCVNGLELYESIIVNQLYSNAPDKFSKCKSNFEMITLMQHYGLPTRFLDFTKNPLVALWFSCEQNQETDGAVYLTFGFNSVNSTMMNLISDMIVSGNSLSLSLEDRISKSELIEYILRFHSYPHSMFFVDAPIIDQRESNQQSIFAVGINKLKVLYPDDYIDGEYVTDDKCDDILNNIEKYSYEIDEGVIECYGEGDIQFILKIIIPSEIKNQMLDELAWRGINESFIYPTLENSAKNVKNEALRKICKLKERHEFLKKYAQVRLDECIKEDNE